MRIIFKYILLLIALIYCEAGHGQTTVTFTTATVRGSVEYGSIDATKYYDEMLYNGIKISCNDAAFNSPNHDYYIFYAYSTTTISSSVGNIKKIVFKRNAGSTSTNGEFASWKATNGGKLTIITSKEKATWTGDASSVTIQTNGRTYVSEIQVTYEPSNPQVEFTGNDDATTITSYKGKTVNATIKRSLIADGGWYTLCLPFDATDISPLKGAEIKKYKEMNGTTMVFEDATEIKAGYPYIVKPTSDIVNPVFSNVIVKDEEHNEGADGFYFVATLDKKELTTDGTNLFLGADNKFFIPLEDDKTLFGLRGYFTVPEGTSASKMSIRVEDETTSIKEIRHDEVFDYTIHNISGQSVGNNIKSLPKGIYIHNGKKFAIR